MWVRQLLDEIGLGERIRTPTVVYADNKQANTLCAEDLVTAGNMYFRTGYHYNKEQVRDGYVQVKYVHTSWNLADAMTKALGNSKLKCFKPYLKGHKPIPHGGIPLQMRTALRKGHMGTRYDTVAETTP